MDKGLQIKIVRVRTKTKAIDLSRMLQISPTKLSLIENGHIDCPIELFERINKLLKEKA